MILQQRQFFGDVIGQQVAPYRYSLAKLDEQRAELFERETNTLTERTVTPTTERQQTIDPSNRPKQMCLSDDLIESMTHERALDGQKPQCKPDAQHRQSSGPDLFFSSREMRRSARSTSSRIRSTSAMKLLASAGGTSVGASS